MDLRHTLRFYFITDENAPNCPPLKQAEIAILAGASVIQYRHKTFTPKDFKALEAVRELCRKYTVSFVVNDDIMLAKALDADGVHLGQTDDDLAVAREIMGADAIIGVSVSTLEELEKTNLSSADYIGTGPVFTTDTKSDASPVIGLSGLRAVADKSSLPVVAIGGIDPARVDKCFAHGAAGVAVISCITRAEDPVYAANAMAGACGCRPRELRKAWDNEFALIDKLIHGSAESGFNPSVLKISPGDDAALFKPIIRPVITTDAQRENSHFRRNWQRLDEIGQKAVEITFSDLAASYAKPLGLFVNLSIPSYMSDSDIEKLYAGINRALKKYEAALGGGNVSSGREFSIDLFAVGEGNADIFPLRSSAQPGDGLFVTGPLGMARAGLECLRKNDTGFPKLLEKFKNPRARFGAAEILAAHHVACVMDISDGLAGDAAHIAAASQVSIQFEPSSFKIDPVLAKFCDKYQLPPEKMILAGGEDYELLFACRPEIFNQIKTRLPEAYQVGECLAFAGRALMNVPENVLSFQHGKV